MNKVKKIWEATTAGKYFITDLGEDLEIEKDQKNKIQLGRYAVWKPTEDMIRHQLVEISSDKEYLQKKYHIDSNKILEINTKKR